MLISLSELNSWLLTVTNYKVHTKITQKKFIDCFLLNKMQTVLVV